LSEAALENPNSLHNSRNNEPTLQACSGHRSNKCCAASESTVCTPANIDDADRRFILHIPVERLFRRELVHWLSGVRLVSAQRSNATIWPYRTTERGLKLGFYWSSKCQ
jgi:hypothetical protein